MNVKTSQIRRYVIVCAAFVIAMCGVAAYFLPESIVHHAMFSIQRAIVWERDSCSVDPITEILHVPTSLHSPKQSPVTELRSANNSTAYLERMFPDYRNFEESGIHLEPIPDAPGVRRPRPNVCLRSEFDAVRSRVTLEELYALLGTPMKRQSFAGSTISWICEDNRILEVRPDYSDNPKQLFGFMESNVGKLDYRNPTFGELQMTLYRGGGRVRIYFIPTRKSGEVEHAVKQRQIRLSTNGT